MIATQDLHVKEFVPLLPPRALKAELPMTDEAGLTVAQGRETIRRMSQELGIGHKQDDAEGGTIEFTYEELYRLCRSSIRPV